MKFNWKKNWSQFCIWLLFNVFAGLMCYFIELMVNDGLIDEKRQTMWQVTNSFASKGGFSAMSLSFIWGAFGMLFSGLSNNHFEMKKRTSSFMIGLLLLSVLVFAFDIAYYTIQLLTQTYNTNCPECKLRQINDKFHWNSILIVLAVISFLISLGSFIVVHNEEISTVDQEKIEG